MKVIVCGAGRVGFNIARYLSEDGNDVIVVDQSAELTKKIGKRLHLLKKLILGHGLEPVSYTHLTLPTKA